MSNNTLDIRKILDTLPHRYPFILVDKVISLVPNETITAIKNVTINEEFFQGHFPNYPVMPGVLIIESLAQTAGILSFKSMNKTADDDTLYFFVGIDNCRFKKPVVPGDVLNHAARVGGENHPPPQPQQHDPERERQHYNRRADYRHQAMKNRPRQTETQRPGAAGDKTGDWPAALK